MTEFEKLMATLQGTAAAAVEEAPADRHARVMESFALAQALREEAARWLVDGRASPTSVMTACSDLLATMVFAATPAGVELAVLDACCQGAKEVVEDKLANPSAVKLKTMLRDLIAAGAAERAGDRS